MRLLVTLDKAIELEQKIQSCHEFLCRVTRDGVAAESRQLAQEEESHVNVLRTGRNFVPGTPGAFEREAVSDAEINSGIESAADIEARLKAQNIKHSRALKKVSFSSLGQASGGVEQPPGARGPRQPDAPILVFHRPAGYDDQVRGKKSFSKRAKA